MLPSWKTIFLYGLLGLFSLYSNSEARNGRIARLNRREKSCCYRASKSIKVGKDHQNKEVHVDVGVCKRRCSASPSYAQNLAAPPYTCPRRSTNSCLPTRRNVLRLHLTNGLTQVSQIEDCTCVTHNRNCQRVSRKQVFFPGSPFETEVDVGACVGRCKLDGTRCLATHNKTKAIDSPNGKSLVSVINSCSCQSSCYRAESIEAVYDYSSNSSRPKPLYVDVGQCIGSCSGKLPSCLFFGDRTGECLVRNYLQGNCMPTYDPRRTVKYLTKDGQIRVMLVIKYCNC